MIRLVFLLLYVPSSSEHPGNSQQCNRKEEGLLSRICAGQTSSSASKHLFLTEVQRCPAFSNVLSRIARFTAHRRSCVLRFAGCQQVRQFVSWILVAC